MLFIAPSLHLEFGRLSTSLERSALYSWNSGPLQIQRLRLFPIVAVRFPFRQFDLVPPLD